MAKWSNEKMADLTRKLADTAIEQNELYQAVLRDAKEAEAYAEELEAKLRKSALQELSALGQASEAYQAQLAAEAKLSKCEALLAQQDDLVQAAVERGFWLGRSCGGSKAEIDAALAAIRKGVKND